MRSGIPISSIAILVGVFILAWSSPTMGDNISLSELYPKEKLGSLLIPRAQWRPFPKVKDRAEWTSIAEPIRGLPDTSEPIVALFSAETANSLAWTVYLLKEQLDTVSPQVCKRTEREIDLRILTPYLERDNFGWMAFHARSDGRRPNNWNPWINSNVLAATLLVEKNETRRLDLAQKVLRCLDNFLVPYPSDGSCDEGPSYWGHAGASVFDNLELLYSASGDRFDLYENSVIREIGRFIYRAHISDDYFVNVGDCDARLDISRDLVFRYGRRIKDTNMQSLATYDLREEELFEAERSFRSMFGSATKICK
jgi:hypothetical protein